MPSPLPKYGQWKDTPTTDVQVDGCIVHWSEKKRRPAPSKKHPKLTLGYIPITCRCGKKFETNLYKLANRHTLLCPECSRLVNRCKGPNHADWKGGICQRANGYIAININALPEQERGFFTSMGQGQNKAYVLEHRLVMAQHLGRPLSRQEIVHHINGIKTDNRIENLCLLSPSEHAMHELMHARAEIGRLRKILDGHNIPY